MLIDARNVTKAFGAFKAVDDASVSVEEGDILGLIGPNGAGKSTFFNCLTGDLAVTSGNVTFNGADVTRLPPSKRTCSPIRPSPSGKLSRSSRAPACTATPRCTCRISSWATGT